MSPINAMIQTKDRFNIYVLESLAFVEVPWWIVNIPLSKYFYHEREGGLHSYSQIL